MTLALQVNPGLLQCNKHAETMGLGGDAENRHRHTSQASSRTFFRGLD
jgi:hypothetical protein